MRVRLFLFASFSFIYFCSSFLFLCPRHFHFSFPGKSYDDWHAYFDHAESRKGVSGSGFPGSTLKFFKTLPLTINWVELRGLGDGPMKLYLDGWALTREVAE